MTAGGKALRQGREEGVRNHRELSTGLETGARWLVPGWVRDSQEIPQQVRGKAQITAALTLLACLPAPWEAGSSCRL